MQRTVICFVVSLLVLSANISFGQDLASETAVLDAALTSFETNFNNRDAKALSQEYAEDANVLYSPGEKLVGRSAIESYYIDHFKKNPKVVTKFTNVSRKMLASGIVVEDGDWAESGHTEEGLPTKGFYTVIMVKRDSSWLILHDRSWPDENAGK